MQMTEEQRKELEEKLKNMSPEELKQLQMQQCIFCQIASGKIPAKTIYDDDKIKIVLDINPAAPGHCLIIPKEHFMILPQVPDEIIAHMFAIARKLSLAILRSMKVDGTSWFVANGQVAGQNAQHVMAHVIPRVEKDNIGLFLPSKELDDQTAAALKEKLSGVVKDILSGKSPLPKPSSPQPASASQPAPALPPAQPPESEKPTPEPIAEPAPQTPPPVPEPSPVEKPEPPKEPVTESEEKSPQLEEVSEEPKEETRTEEKEMTKEDIAELLGRKGFDIEKTKDEELSEEEPGEEEEVTEDTFTEPVDTSEEKNEEESEEPGEEEVTEDTFTEPVDTSEEKSEESEEKHEEPEQEREEETSEVHEEETESSDETKEETPKDEEEPKEDQEEKHEEEDKPKGDKKVTLDDITNFLGK